MPGSTDMELIALKLKCFIFLFWPLLIILSGLHYALIPLWTNLALYLITLTPKCPIFMIPVYSSNEPIQSGASKIPHAKPKLTSCRYLHEHS